MTIGYKLFMRHYRPPTAETSSDESDHTIRKILQIRVLKPTKVQKKKQVAIKTAEPTKRILEQVDLGVKETLKTIQQTQKKLQSVQDDQKSSSDKMILARFRKRLRR